MPQINPDLMSVLEPMGQDAGDVFLADDLKNNAIAALRYRIRYEFDSISRITEISERAIAEEQQRRKEAVESELAKFEPGSDDYFFTQGFYQDDLLRVAEDIPRVFRYAILAGMMSLVESSFVRLIRLVQDSSGHQFAFDEKKPGVINRAIRYLEKHANVNASKISSLDTLRDLVLIRNCIVHNEGIIDRCKGKDKIRGYIASNPSSTENEKGSIFLDSNFVRNHRHVMLQILVRYCNILEKKPFF